MSHFDSPWKTEFKADTPIVSAPVPAGDILVFSTEGKLYGLSLYDGSQLWQYQVARGIPEIVSAGGTLFFMGDPEDYGVDSDDDFGLVALDAATGMPKQQWQTASDRDGLRNPVFQNGVLMFSDGDGNIHGFNAVTGARVWESLSVGATPGPAGQGDQAVFFVANGALKGVNLRSGQTRWR